LLPILQSMWYRFYLYFKRWEISDILVDRVSH
jgi:hypothetical protein